MTRLRISHGLIIVGFVFLCLVLIYHQLIQFSRYQQLSQANRIRILPQSASRGSILDRNNNLLADSIFSYDLLIMPGEGDYPAEKISKLSSILSISQEQLKLRYKDGYTAAFLPILLSKDISLSQAVAIGQLKYDLPEVIIQANPKRIYPLGNATSHLLGYLSQIDIWRLEQLKEYGYKTQDLVGYSGVEEVYDYLLHPIDGGMQVEVDSKGRLSRILGFKPPQKGRDIQLTIDLRLQKIIHRNLKGRTGCIIVLNPINGEVLALASFPDFNPEVFQQGSPALIDSLLNDPDAPLFNRAINGLYPAGSLFKIVIAAAGLEKKKINTGSKFFCSGKMQIGKRQFSCWEIHQDVDIVSALARSCNVFFYNLGLALGPQLINEYGLKFGFSQPTGIDLGGESAGLLPYSLWQRIKRRKRWFAGDTANLSIGQGELLVTPLQITRMMAAVANGGKLIKPRLLKSIDPSLVRREKIEDVSVVIGPWDDQVASSLISKESLQIIRRGLIGAVTQDGGTANILADLGISIAGKTGSTQVARGAAHGWFVSFFPVEQPRFVMCVFLEHAGAGYYSCQLTKRIIEQMRAEGLL